MFAFRLCCFFTDSFNSLIDFSTLLNRTFIYLIMLLTASTSLFPASSSCSSLRIMSSTIVSLVLSLSDACSTALFLSDLWFMGLWWSDGRSSTRFRSDL